MFYTSIFGKLQNEKTSGVVCRSFVVICIHDAGKRASVWTVNTRRAMTRFLDSEVDFVITDDILMAIDVQKELDERTDYDIIKDRSSDLWFY